MSQAVQTNASSGPLGLGVLTSLRATSPSTASSLTTHTHASSSCSLSTLSGDQTPTPSPYSAISGMLSPTLQIKDRSISPFVLSEQSVRANWAKKLDINRSNFFKISLFLSPEEVARGAATCKSWKSLLDTQEVWKKQQEAIPNAIFPSHYTTLFGVKVVNPIPPPWKKMLFENNQPDPNRPWEKVEKTHIWVYNPIVEINGKVRRLTTGLLEQLVANPRLKFPATIGYKTINDTPMGEAGWLLIRREIFDDTAGLQWDKQVEIVEAKGYQIPYGPDVLLTGLVWRVLTGEYLFEQDFTATRALGSKNEGMWIGICDDLHGFSALRCARTGVSDISTGFVGIRYDTRTK
ncbi:MAG TPA: F-box protein [Rhabdochlamydiaceae bacterium]|nr:F-box protein [Rhabdochlamydiaceae bacterium]